MVLSNVFSSTILARPKSDTFTIGELPLVKRILS
jgi:hypothetical protein